MCLCVCKGGQLCVIFSWGSSGVKERNVFSLMQCRSVCQVRKATNRQVTNGCLIEEGFAEFVLIVCE